MSAVVALVNREGLYLKATDNGDGTATLASSAVIDAGDSIALVDGVGGVNKLAVTAANAAKVDGSAVTQPVSAVALPLPTGAATEATLATRLSESDFDAKAGSLTETPPATDTASSGLNGRLQRLAQRITSLMALLPTSLGQKAMSASLAVTVASDQASIPVAGATAAGAANAGNPIKGGGVARTAAPSAVADGQIVDDMRDKWGRTVVVGSIADLNIDQSTTITNSTSETTIVTADAANKHNLHMLFLSNSGAVGTEVSIRDTTAGTVRFNMFVPAGMTIGFVVFESGSIKQAAVNTNWTAQCSVATTSLKVFAKVTKIPS